MIAARATVAGVTQDTAAPKFALWDAFLTQRLGRGLSAFLTIDNLADSQGSEYWRDPARRRTGSRLRPEAGRTARLGVQWSFSARGLPSR